MKILCVIESLGQGGAERQLIELATGFKEKGFDTSFLVYHEDTFFNHFLEKAGIPIKNINERNYLRRLIKMRHFIRSGNFNIIVSFLESSNFICELSGIPKKKWVLMVGERSANPNIYKSIKLIIFRFFHIYADYIVANTISNIKIVKRINPFLSDNKCKVIYNIIDFTKWYPKKNFSFKKDGKLNIIISSSYRYLKNLDGLLEAILLLSHEERSSISITWYGDILDNSMNEGKLKINKYKLNDVVFLHTATAQINDIIQEADIVALFSFYEGFPNAVCEGMACAKPIICSAISDIPIFIKNKNLLFDPANRISIANTLKYVINLNNDELIKIGQENYDCSRRYFDKGKIINQYLELLINKLT